MIGVTFGQSNATGALNLSAGNDITIDPGQATQSVDDHFYTRC